MRSKELLLKSIFFAVISLGCLAILSDIFLPKNEFGLIARVALTGIFSNVCHQETGKTFSINGYHLLVCARCTGIYLGIWIISLLMLLNIISIKKIGLNILLLGMLPILLDVLLYNLHIYSYSKTVALTTGLIFSITLTIFFISNILTQKSNDK